MRSFWSAEYRGRPIAILSRLGRLHVYLDHVVQQDGEDGTSFKPWRVRLADKRRSAQRRRGDDALPMREAMRALGCRSQTRWGSHVFRT